MPGTRTWNNNSACGVDMAWACACEMGNWTRACRDEGDGVMGWEGRRVAFWWPALWWVLLLVVGACWPQHAWLAGRWDGCHWCSMEPWTALCSGGALECGAVARGWPGRCWPSGRSGTFDWCAGRWWGGGKDVGNHLCCTPVLLEAFHFPHVDVLAVLASFLMSWMSRLHFWPPHPPPPSLTLSRPHLQLFFLRLHIILPPPCPLIRILVALYPHLHFTATCFACVSRL